MISPLTELKESRDDLVLRFSKGKVSETFQEQNTEIVDRYFRRGVQESKNGHRLFKEKKPFAFVAVGGYGRKELCLHSDIDIIILFDSKIPHLAKELAKEILFPLWDLGLDLGYAIRSIKDCMSLSKGDFQVLTSMLDARFVCGESPLFLSLMEKLEKKVISKRAVAFYRWLGEQDKIRLETTGDASHLLEPNLKEGIGGLRDYHHILWLGRTFFNLRAPRDLEYNGKLSHNEYKGLQEHLQFIWRTRNHLHQLSGRNNDRLGFEYQEEIARRLGFKDQKEFLAVEQFLGKLHASMGSLKALQHSFANNLFPKKAYDEDIEPSKIQSGLHLHHDEIAFDSPTVILANPQLLMDVFKEGARLGCQLSLEAMRIVKEFIYLVDDDFRQSKKVVQGFLNVLGHQDGLGLMDQIFETGLLDAFIPEFSEIKDRVQFDAYHIFPVGRHSLETLKHLKTLSATKEFLLLDIIADINHPESLFLAGLLHDIGKVGKDHARKGAGITRKVLERFHYEKNLTENILFLIRHHLLLVETATRRDLHDEKVVVQCARTIGTIQRLKMLYLLTWADSKATGPRAWTGWIASLVQELFFKALHILEGGDLAGPKATQKVKYTRAAVKKKVSNWMDPRDLERYFDAMSPRYLLKTSAKAVSRHLKMVKKFEEQPKDAAAFCLETVKDESGGFWEITFLARDRPGLFSDLAGVMALNNINILSADIYTWRDRTALDIFRVTKPLDQINPYETWKKVERDLRYTFIGRLSLEYRLGKKAAPSIPSDSKKPTRPSKVIVDNKSSDFFTLIEVFANDRIGLLYLITRCLFDLRLDIRIAKIATKGDQVADVFYVRDLEGQKVEDSKQLLEIKSALLHRLQMTGNPLNSSDDQGLTLLSLSR